LRIISGKYKGRKILAPENLPVRPTTDFAKTGLFNILQNRLKLESCTCLDLFSGTGCISLELISRSCKEVVSVDKDAGCIKFQSATQKKLGITNWIINKTDVVPFLKNNNKTFDLIFADPPFDFPILEEIHQLVFNQNLLIKSGLLILEHVSTEKYDHLKGFIFERKYGNVSFSFFHNFDEQA
jgi:16S rRNA (guanine966-N2)-methyltransferase